MNGISSGYSVRKNKHYERSQTKYTSVMDIMYHLDTVLIRTRSDTTLIPISRETSNTINFNSDDVDSSAHARWRVYLYTPVLAIVHQIFIVWNLRLLQNQATRCHVPCTTPTTWLTVITAADFACIRRRIWVRAPLNRIFISIWRNVPTLPTHTDEVSRQICSKRNATPPQIRCAALKPVRKLLSLNLVM